MRKRTHIGQVEIHIIVSSVKGGRAIELIVHYPNTPEKQAELSARIAKFHAEYVTQYIEKLNCPTEQKLKLIDAIVQTVLESCKEKDNSPKTEC